MNLFI